ncbi:MAG TPA: hypothetical protein VEQ10_16755, partial [Vicinamibacteria bacterium]|nr:hypothetical protein [Vicinamibacteria bacterium]
MLQLPFDPSAGLGVTLARLLAVTLALAAATAAAAAEDPAYARAAGEAKQALLAKHGQGEADRIERGTAQVLRFWRPQDGEPAALAAFA